MSTRSLRKKKKRTLTSYKKQAWRLLSQIIRLEGADRRGYVVCVTCSASKHWKQMQAGHFIDGRYVSILFDERGIWPQCSNCNVILNGHKDSYWVFMETNLGREVIDDLRQKKNETVAYTREQYEARIAEYKGRLSKLMAEVGV